MLITERFYTKLNIHDCKTQIGTTDAVENYDNFAECEAFLERNRDKNLYFLAGVNALTNSRASDDDVVKRNYVYFDFDIRKSKPEITDEEIRVEAKKIQDCLSKDPLLQNYGALVFTGNGLHVYYFSEPIEVAGKKSIYAAGYGIISKKILELTGWEVDSACKNLARIARMPGSLNNKNKPAPLVEILFFFDRSSGVLAEILRQGAVVNVEKREFVLDESNEFWAVLSTLNNRVMLRKLSGSRLVRGEVFDLSRPRSGGGNYIDIDGKEANCWIDSSGLIGSGSRGANGKVGGPTWIQWLEWYGVPKNEIAEWAKRELGEILSGKKRTDRVEKVNDYSSDDLERDALGLMNQQPSGVTWGVPVIDRLFGGMEFGHYAIIVGESSAGKTAFAFQMAYENAAKGIPVLYLSFENRAASIVSRRARNVAGITSAEWASRDIPDSKKILYKQAIRIPEMLHLKDLKIGTIPLPSDVEEFIKTGKYRLVFIDNFGFMSANQKNEWDDLRVISKEFVGLTKGYNVGIVALHHFNKGAGKRSGPRGMSSVRGSGKLENDVEWLIQVWRQTDPDSTLKMSEHEKRELSVICHKDREEGKFVKATVYYQNGVFVDEVIDVLPF